MAVLEVAAEAVVAEAEVVVAAVEVEVEVEVGVEELALGPVPGRPGSLVHVLLSRLQQAA